MASTVLYGLLLAALTAASALPPTVGSSVSEDAVVVRAQAEHDRRGTARGPLLVAARGAVAYVYAYVPACSGNAPGGEILLCAVASVGCPDGELRYWAYRSPAAADPRAWTRNGNACLAAGAVGADGAEVAIGFTVEDFRRLPLPPAAVTVEPPGGRVLINIETNAVATAAVTTLPTEVLGQPVTVRATPVAYTWDFGDGTTLGPTTDPGAAWPVLGTTHVYTAPGAYQVTLTTTYTGEFSVAGGPYLPIDGTATVSSPSQPLAALSATTDLVAEPLA